MSPIVSASLVLTFLSSSALADIREDFTRSRDRWHQYNQDHARMYRYTTVFESWIGWGHNTHVTVMGDRVVERSFERWRWYYDYEDGNKYKREIVQSWMEGPLDLGTHEEGESPRTMDQVYADCERDVLGRDPEQFVLDFTTDSKGILKTCRARDIYCADDCWEGVEIEAMILH